MALKGLASYVGKDNIMEAFDRFGDNCPVYSVWYADKSKAFDYMGADCEQGRDLFETTIDALVQNGNTRLFSLKFHPGLTKGLINNKSDYSCCLLIQAVQDESSEVMPSGAPGQMSYKMFQALETLNTLPNKIDQMIDAKLSSIRLELEALKAVDYDEPEIDPVTKVLGYINGVMENPSLSPLILALIGKIFPGPAPQRAINGTAESPAPVSEAPVNGQIPVDMDMLNNALAVLNKYCKIDTDLQLLANMAETNNSQFTMLLGMLRS